MNEETKLTDVKRGIVAQREHPSGRVTARSPKKVKLETRQWDDEEWSTWAKYHTEDDARKAAKSVSKQRVTSPVRFWRVDGVEFTV
jgi:hypothetical protein